MRTNPFIMLQALLSVESKLLRTKTEVDLWSTKAARFSSRVYSMTGGRHEYSSRSVTRFATFLQRRILSRRLRSVQSDIAGQRLVLVGHETPLRNEALELIRARQRSGVQARRRFIATPG
jgi:hypothetical protein